MGFPIIFKNMGFPIGYTELFTPKFMIHILTLLAFIRNLLSPIFRFVRIGEPELSTGSSQTDELFDHFRSVSSLLTRELLPVVRYSELVDPPESCAVCLYEFDKRDEVRQLMNCRHVFHRSCVDRWMDQCQKSCPLCRKPFVPEDLQDSFNERLWAASGIADYYGDSLVVSDY